MTPSRELAAVLATLRRIDAMDARLGHQLDDLVASSDEMTLDAISGECEPLLLYYGGPQRWCGAHGPILEVGETSCSMRRRIADLVRARSLGDSS